MYENGWMVNGGLVEGTLVTPAQLALALLLNLALALVFWRWLARQRAEVPRWLGRLLLPAVSLRLLVAVFSGFYPSPDSSGFAAYGWIIMRQLWAEPVGWLHMLFGNEFVFEDWRMVFYGMSNTFFFHKLLGLLNVVTLSNSVLNAAYLSLFCLLGGWQLVRALLQRWPGAAPGAAVAFLLWPTLIFWTSTYTKESVLLGSGAWLLALVVQVLYGPPPASRRAAWGRGAGLLGLAFVHFNMRYFFAAPLLGLLLGLAAARAAERLGLVRRRAAQALLVLAVLGVGAWLAPQLSLAFRLNKFTSQMIKVYTHHLKLSADRPHFEYPGLVPTAESALRHVPQAVVNALTRPVLGESAGPRYLAGGLENAALLALLGLALAAAWRRRSPGALPFALVFALVMYCLLIAALLGLTVPNFGALNRYRSAMLPYLLLLLLQNAYATRLLRRLGLG